MYAILTALVFVLVSGSARATIQVRFECENDDLEQKYYVHAIYESGTQLRDLHLTYDELFDTWDIPPETLFKNPGITEARTTSKYVKFDGADLHSNYTLTMRKGFFDRATFPLYLDIYREDVGKSEITLTCRTLLSL